MLLGHGIAQGCDVLFTFAIHVLRTFAQPKHDGGVASLGFALGASYQVFKIHLDPVRGDSLSSVGRGAGTGLLVNSRFSGRKHVFHEKLCCNRPLLSSKPSFK